MGEGEEGSKNVLVAIKSADINNYIRKRFRRSVSDSQTNAGGCVLSCSCIEGNFMKSKRECGEEKRKESHTEK